MSRSLSLSFCFFFTSIPPRHLKQPPVTITPLLPSYPRTLSISRSNLSLSLSLFPHLCVRIYIYRIVMLCYVRLLHYRSVCKFTRGIPFCPPPIINHVHPVATDGLSPKQYGTGKKKLKCNNIPRTKN
jgi:hypothetical protein